MRSRIPLPLLAFRLASHWIARAFTFRAHRRSYPTAVGQSSLAEKWAARAGVPSWLASPIWFPRDTPPRLHNRATPLIDGESFLAALQEALVGAREYVFIAGWCLTPLFPLSRKKDEDLLETQLLRLLSNAAHRVPVRLLLWSGAPVLYEPTIRRVKATKALIERQGSGDLLCRLDHRAHFTHCIHQKAIVVDGRIAFVGGMDLTTFTGDRWDTPAHPLRVGLNWHDVQVRIEGEAAADVENNFRQRWEAAVPAGGRDLPPPNRPDVDDSWQTPVQIVRTIPARTYDFAPDGEFGIYHFYIEAIRRAKRLIYLENQYIWSPHVVDALVDAMNAPHDEPFRIVMVLPARAGDGRWDNDKHIDQLLDADKGRGIFSAYSLYASGANMGETPFSYRAIYVHAKVGIIDDEWLTIGSANLNNRGLTTDGEMNAVIHDPEIARSTRLDLWAEHLALPRDRVAEASVATLVDGEWKRRAAENARIIKQGDKPLPSAVHRYMVGRGPGDLVLEDVQSLTFEY